MADRLQIDILLNTKSIDAQLKALEAKTARKKINVDVGGSDQVAALSKNTKDASTNIQKLGENIAAIPLKFAQWYIVSGIVTGFIGSIKDGIQSVADLDKAVTNIQFTMDLTSREIETLTDNSFEMAQALNTSVKEAMVANQIFSNMSASLQSINEKSETTIALANLTGSSVSKMADAVQGISFQFDLASDKSQELADVLVTLGQKTGTEFTKSVQGMTDAVARAGSVSADAGFSYNEFLSVISVVQEQTRLTGASIASGLVTSLSRLNKVTDASSDEISKVETALNKVGVQLRDSNGEFRNSYTVLQELSKVYTDLTSVEQSEIGFLIAGTRQRKVFNNIMDNMGTITERANDSISNQGETMRLNAIYAESLAGKTADFKNSMEALFNTIISSNALKSVVDVGIDIVDTLKVIEETFGILNTAVLLGTSIFVAFKAKAIISMLPWIKLILTDFNAFAITFDLLRTKALGAINTMGALRIAMGALPIVIGAVITGIALYKKAQEELTQRINENNESLKEQVSNYNNLNEEQRKALELKAQETFAETTTQLKKANEALAENTKNLKANSEIRDVILSKQESGEELTNAEINQLKGLNKAIDGNNEKISNSESVINAHNMSLAIMRGDLREYTDEMEANTDVVEENTESTIENTKANNEAVDKTELFKRALRQLNETGKVSAETMAILVDQFPDLAEELSSNEVAVDNYEKAFENMTVNQLSLQSKLTDSAIENAKKRIIAYQTEIDSINKLIAQQILAEGEVGGVNVENLLGTKRSLGGELDSLSDLQSKGTAISNVLSKLKKDRSKEPDAIKYLSSQHALIAKLNRELQLLQNQNESGLAADDQVISKLREKQSALSSLADELRKQSATLDPLSEDYNKLQDEIASLSAEHYSAKKAIEAFAEAQKTKLLDSLKETNKSLEEQKDKLEELSEAYQDDLSEAILKTIGLLEEESDKNLEAIESSIKAKQDEIDTIKEANAEKEKANALAEKELELANLKLQRSNILQEKNTKILKDGKFVFEANPADLRKNAEAIADTEQELIELKKKNEYEERIAKLEADKEALEEQKRGTKESYDNRIKALKDFNTEQKRQIKREGKIQESLLDNIRGAIIASDRAHWKETVDGYKNMVSQINDALGDIKSIDNEININQQDQDSGGRSNTILVREISTGKETTLSRGVWEGSADVRRRYEALNTGGRTTSDGMAMLHKDEVVLNPAQVSRTVGDLGLQGGSPASNAQSLFSFANGANLPQFSTNNNTTTSSPIDQSIKIDSVIVNNPADFKGFTSELRSRTRNRS